MKSMLIAVLFAGGVIAGLILYGNKKLNKADTDLANREKNRLPADALPERNPVHSMG